MKGYKISDAERKYAKVGIAAESLKDLKLRTVAKFQTIWKDIKPNGDIYFQLSDGTRVDSEEYFQTLAAQTNLIWVECGERAETDVERLLRIIKQVNNDYLSAGKQVEHFLAQQLHSNVIKLQNTILNNIDLDKVKLSTRQDHPEWFKGLDTRSRTKEEYLNRRCQDRIRGYYYKAKDDLMKYDRKRECAGGGSGGVDGVIVDLLNYLQEQLKLFKYFGCYFDRSLFSDQSKKIDSKQICLCIDPIGTFQCQGMWNERECLFNPKHRINPYATRESRILFQTWNLDHVIERSRAIVPAIISSDSCGSNELNHKMIFNDLFTLNNLKLVHIVCHDKAKHVIPPHNQYYLLVEQEDRDNLPPGDKRKQQQQQLNKQMLNKKKKFKQAISH